MARDTFSFTVEGDVELGSISSSLQRLATLVKELSAEIAKGTTIRWHLEDIKRGSATAVFRGDVEGSPNSDAAERIVRGLGIVATAVVAGDTIPYSMPVQEAAIALTRAIQGSITAIYVQTDEVNVAITTPIPDEEDRISRTHGLGSVDGIVETLQRRNGYAFTLYDTLLDRAITCHLRPDQEDLMREVWGKRVRVTGYIGRDPLTGRALDIRDIWQIQILPEIAPGSYKAALGLLQSEDPTPPEELVRRLRDAE
jgi:hypothetical protein